ncbi:30S ribosomal protein S20 [Candidatus Saccharibacteria bacterium]|nr:30S ribosomal protein S20 [Candidatus Saccharibacteria bacterium]
MPIIKSAKKAARQANKRTEHNVDIKKAIKNALKAFKAKPSAKTLSAAQSEYDKAVKKDLMKKNTASRRKAKLYEMAKAAGVKMEKAAKKPATKPAVKKAAEKPAAKKPAAKTTAKEPAAKKTQSKAKAEKK